MEPFHHQGLTDSGAPTRWSLLETSQEICGQPATSSPSPGSTPCSRAAPQRSGSFRWSPAAHSAKPQAVSASSPQTPPMNARAGSTQVRATSTATPGTSTTPAPSTQPSKPWRRARPAFHPSHRLPETAPSPGSLDIDRPTWEDLLSRLPPVLGPQRPELDDRKRQIASIYVWV